MKLATSKLRSSILLRSMNRRTPWCVQPMPSPSSYTHGLERAATPMIRTYPAPPTASAISAIYCPLVWSVALLLSLNSCSPTSFFSVLLSFISLFLKRDYHVIVYNSRGVGNSGGSPSLSGLAEVHDLQVVVDLALREIDAVDEIVLLVRVLASPYLCPTAFVLCGMQLSAGLLIWLPCGLTSPGPPHIALQPRLTRAKPTCLAKPKNTPCPYILPHRRPLAPHNVPHHILHRETSRVGEEPRGGRARVVWRARPVHQEGQVPTMGE